MNEDDLVNMQSASMRNQDNQSSFNQTHNFKSSPHLQLPFQGPPKKGSIQNFINELSIESVDELGRINLKSVSIGSDN